jgi:phosphoribosylamine--glycine ligase
VGPEQPLVDGIVDYLERYKIKVFGPSKLASQLEGSKIFTKNLCKKYNIPTANFGIFKNSEDANKFLEKCNLPIVIKADGLASGKGVYICNSKDEGLTAIREYLRENLV